MARRWSAGREQSAPPIDNAMGWGQGDGPVSITEAIAVLAIYFGACVALSWVLRRGLIGMSFFKLRIALRKQLPAGYYRWEQADSISVGKPDTVIVFKMPFQASPDRRPVTHVAVTDSATRFSVGDELVGVDPFLEAYDDERGPLVVHVQEVGKIATIGIDTDAHLPNKPIQADGASPVVE